MAPRNNSTFPIPEIETEMKEEDVKEKGVDFEKAIAATGYGKFQYLLFLIIVPVAWASSFDTSNLSMVLPSAECDLNLSLVHKGLLNGSTYAGLVISALMWGFLADVVGRRRILIYCLFANGICNVLSGLSQNFAVLVFFKFFSGFFISGPYATKMTYCTEFHCTKDRPRVLLFVGLVCFSGCIVNAGLAWLVIPQEWSLTIGDNLFIYNSWRIYLSLCGVPIIIGAIGLIFFPESPKFLMSQGRNDEALKIFQKMYSMNTGCPPESYPILSLENEVYNCSSSSHKCTKSIKTWIYEGFVQMKPLIGGTYCYRLALVMSIQFCGMLCYNTLRLWQPQLSAILNDFASLPYDASHDNFTFCEILDYSTTTTANDSADTNFIEAASCVVKPVDDMVYLDTIIISSVTVGCVFLASIFVNLVGNKNLLLICYVIAICSVIAMNWSPSQFTTLSLTCLFVGFLDTSLNLVISIIIILFPTTLRTMAVSLAMMVGRAGSLLGNVMFPVLLDYGCLAAVVALAVFLFVSTFLTMFIPKPKELVK